MEENVNVIAEKLKILVCVNLGNCKAESEAGLLRERICRVEYVLDLHQCAYTFISIWI